MRLGIRAYWLLLVATASVGCQTEHPNLRPVGASPPVADAGQQSSVGTAKAGKELREQRIKREILARELSDAPFLTLKVGPKSVASADDARPFACKDSHGMECVVSGDADGTHRFIWVVPWKTNVYAPSPTNDDLRKWKTERGFGIGSLYDEVWEKIGHPTLTTQVDKYRVETYRWDYGMDYGDGPFLASYQMDIVYRDDKVVGIMIDISEGP